MKAKDLLLFTLFISCTCVAKAQVNLQRGKPEFSVPIFDFADKVNRISISVLLNYVGGNGIKVNSIASDVGLGWELTPPGVIVRKQNGEPDDQKKMNSLAYVPWKGYYEPGFWNPPPSPTEVLDLEDLNKHIFGNGYLFNTVNPEVPINASAAYVPGYEIPQGSGYLEVGFKQPLDQLHDREQDIFNFEFNGRKGGFIFSKSGEIKILEDSKLKITPTFLDMSSSNIRTQIKSFTVTDEFGIQYVFNDNSLEELCTYKRTRSVIYQTNGEIFNSPLPVPYNPQLPHIDTYDATPINQFVITKWYLSDIINPMTNKSIHFEYDSYAIDCISSRDLTLTSVPSTPYINKSISITNVRVKTTEKRLKKIDLPDGSFVQYDYNPNSRVDLSNSNSLKKISINNGGHQINQEFEYGYFVKKEIRNESDALSVIERKYARLCLKAITKTGENSSNGGVYKFDYFTGFGSTIPNDNVPPRLMLPTDLYGYYYYHSISEYNPNELEHNYTYQNFNHLSQYFNITGYLNNSRLRQSGTIYYRNGLLQRITNPYKGTVEFAYEPNLKFDDSQLNNNTYYGGARVAKTTQFDGINHSNDIINEYKYIKPDGSCSIWGNDPSLINYFSTSSRQYKSRVTLKAGKIAKEFAIGLAIAMCANLGNQDGSSYLDAAGGYYQSFMWQLFQNILMNELGYIFSPDYTTMAYTTSTYFPLSFKNYLPEQFSRVEVKKGSTLFNSGKTVFEFTSDQDYPIDVPVYDFPFSSEHRFFNQAYGLTKKITYFNSTNNKVKEIENFYDYKKNIINQPNYASQNWATLTTFSARYLDGILNINTIPVDAVTRKIYYPITGRVELTRTAETIYNNNNPLIISTDYFYNLNNYLLARKETTDSKGRAIKNLSFFSEDYNLSSIPVLQGLVNNNIVNLPISSETWQIKPGNSPEMLSADVIEFILSPNGDYKPKKNYRLQADRPVSQNSIGIFDPNVLVRNPAIGSPLIIPIDEITYDNFGNPVQTKDIQGDRINSIFYAYNNLYPVAIINNATINEIAYSSFESFESGFIYKNWDLSNGEVLTEPTPTGNKCFSLKTNFPATVIQTNPTIAITKDYKLSFWSNSSGFIVNSGINPYFTGITLNGWTYYEFNLPAGSQPPVITGNCKIDELRLYPKNASMVTTTYEPGIGKTSECDINNHITYYEYDGLGRISKVLDDHHNIIKTYEYHFKN